MKVRIQPGSCGGTVRIPPSKSMAHRAVICAALAQGTSVIENIAYSEDVKTTLLGMEQLGAKVERGERSVTITGVDSLCNRGDMVVDCNESGSTLRFFIPIFSLTGAQVTFLGKNRLLQRPQSVYERIFRQQGLHYLHTDEQIRVQGALQPGCYEVDGNISSQFISGLLFALPLLPQDSTIVIRPPYESRSYIDLTLQMMAQFGVYAHYTDPHTLVVPGKQRYKACHTAVEGDYSQLAFYATWGAIAGDIHCQGVAHDSLQGDKAILAILQNAGARIEPAADGYRVYKSDLHGTEIDLSDCPDLGPILTVLGMYAQGRTRIYHAARLRYKESDRIAAMETELNKLGVSISSTEDEIVLQGAKDYEGCVHLDGHKDHRIVMSLAVAAACCRTESVIDGAQAIGKSYPNFFEDAALLGMQGEQMDD